MIRPIVFLAVALAFTGAAAQREVTENRSALQRTVDVVGGSRSANPSGSPQPGYYGGEPADQRYAREQEQARQAASGRATPSPALLSNCNAGGCWDSQGNRYNSTGDGSRFINSEGRLCQAHGKFINCP